MNLTTQLSTFLAQARLEDIPEAVRHEGRRTLLNCLGTALGGCRDFVRVCGCGAR